MDFYDELKRDIAEYEGRHDDLIYLAPELYRLLTNLLDDPKLPSRLRPLVACGIAYFILPADIIPEEIHGPYGYVDDIFACAWIADRLRGELGEATVLRENWEGEGDIVALVEEILGKEQELVADGWPRIARYVGLDALGSKRFHP